MIFRRDTVNHGRFNPHDILASAFVFDFLLLFVGLLVHFLFCFAFLLLLLLFFFFLALRIVYLRKTCGFCFWK